MVTSKRTMTALGAVLALLLATGVSAAGSRQLRAMHMAPAGAPAGARLPSAAPGPIPSEAPADIVFTVTAQAAVLTSSSLTLTNVPAVVQSFSYESKTGIYTTADFADDRPGAYFVSATGRWLDSPVAVLKATSGGRAVSALVSLAEPHYDAASQTLTFKAALLPATHDARLMKGGAAARLAADAAAGRPINMLMDAPAKGLQLSSVGLFIDQNTMRLGALGATESMSVGGSNNGGSRGNSGSSGHGGSRDNSGRRGHGYHEGHRGGDSWNGGGCSGGDCSGWNGGDSSWGGSRDCSGWGCGWNSWNSGSGWNSWDSSRSWDDSSRSYDSSSRGSSGDRGMHSDGGANMAKSG